MVHRDVLREVASQISALAGELQGVISAWQGQAAGAATPAWWARGPRRSSSPR